MREKFNNETIEENLVSPASLEKVFNDEGKTFEELIEELINQVLLKENS
jgi:hypothetical protein